MCQNLHIPIHESIQIDGNNIGCNNCIHTFPILEPTTAKIPTRFCSACNITPQFTSALSVDAFCCLVVLPVWFWPAKRRFIRHCWNQKNCSICICDEKILFVSFVLQMNSESTPQLDCSSLIPTVVHYCQHDNRTLNDSFRQLLHLPSSSFSRNQIPGRVSISILIVEKTA